LLTIAAPAGPQTFANIELDKIHPLLDWFNLMTYDFHGEWSELTNHHAGLYPSKDDPTIDKLVRTKFNADSAVKGYLAAGVPAEKIVLGVPFYGRGWTGVKDVNHGLHQPHSNQLPLGTWEAGNWDYRDLAANYVDKKAKRFWDDAAKAPWLFDTGSGLMISYDDPKSVAAKARYVRANKLGGVMVWELSGDGPKAELLTTLHADLTAKTSPQ
jgi:chitinase